MTDQGDEMTDPALVAGEVLGWRAWRLKPLCAVPPVDPHLLFSATAMSETPWPADRTMTAVCRRTITFAAFAYYGANRGANHDEVAPAMDCTCGVYARATPERVMREYYKGATQGGMAVIGRVRLWGRVIEHEDGYRAQCARVDMLLPLWPPRMDARMRALAARYGATVDDVEAERLVTEWRHQVAADCRVRLAESRAIREALRR